VAGQSGTQRHGLGDVNLGGQGDLGHGLQALQHASGNGLAYTPDGHHLRRLCHWLSLGGNGSFHIFHHDSAPGAGALHLTEVYPMLLC
jgi:hypothetical protein